MSALNTGSAAGKGLSPNDVVTALGNQNLMLPSGTAKIGQFEYDVDLNSSPLTIAELNDLPIKQVGQQFALFISATSRPCPMASLRRPTSFGWTASAAPCLRS